MRNFEATAKKIKHISFLNMNRLAFIVRVLIVAVVITAKAERLSTEDPNLNKIYLLTESYFSQASLQLQLQY